MIVGAYVRRAAPDHPAGAEWAMHDLLAALADRGHTVQLVAEKGHTRSRSIDGVGVYSQATPEEVVAHFIDCDVMLTQLEAIAAAMVLASAYSTPLVHLIHSPSQVEDFGVLPGAAALVAFNTHDAAGANEWWPGDRLVLHPVVRAERYVVEPKGQMATLVGLSHEKGAMRLVRLAEALPGRHFLGVNNAYGDQAITVAGIPGHGDNPAPAGLPPNLGIGGVTTDMRGIYAATRVLLMLGASETYGRVADEAMLSGIPVIAFPTPGIVECCGSAARYAEPHQPKALEALTLLAWTPAWDEWSAAARARAAANRDRSRGEVEEFEHTLQRIVNDPPEMTMTLEPHHA
jgi:glycosyltransferase involved in cell wall biosynthesis